MLVIAGTIRIDPARQEEARAAALEMMKATHEEEGNVAYVFSTDLAEPGLFHIFEKWRSAEDLDLHFAAPHMAAFQKKLGGFGIREMNVEKFEIAAVGPVR